MGLLKSDQATHTLRRSTHHAKYLRGAGQSCVRNYATQAVYDFYSHEICLLYTSLGAVAP